MILLTFGLETPVWRRSSVYFSVPVRVRQAVLGFLVLSWGSPVRRVATRLSGEHLCLDPAGDVPSP